MDPPPIIAAPRNDLFEEVAQLGRAPSMHDIETVWNAVAAHLNHDSRMDDLEAALDEASDDDILSLQSLLLDQLRRRRLDARSRADDLAPSPHNPPLARPLSRRRHGVTVRLPAIAFGFPPRIARNVSWTSAPLREPDWFNRPSLRETFTTILAGPRGIDSRLFEDLRRGGMSARSWNRARRRAAARRREQEQPHHMVMDANDEPVAFVPFGGEGEGEQCDVRDDWYYMHQVAIDLVVIGLFRLAIIGPHWIYG